MPHHKMPLTAHFRYFIAASLFAYSFTCLAGMQQMLQDIQDSDFVFSRSDNHFPFFPIASLQYTQYSEENNASKDISDQDYSFDQFMILPAWVAKKNMILVGETLSSRRIELNDERFTQNKLGVILAWVQQPTPQWQWGAFSYIQYYNNGHSQVSNNTETLSGAIARYSHSPNLHSWYGLVYDSNAGDGYFLPYIGVDWMINSRWMLSFIPPWPSISYISTSGWITKLGIVPGQTRSTYSATENVLIDDFSYWNMGLNVEKEIKHNIWAGVTIGYSGFGKFTLTDDQLEHENDLDSTPFFKLSFNFRPN